MNIGLHFNKLLHCFLIISTCLLEIIWISSKSLTKNLNYLQSYHLKVTTVKIFSRPSFFFPVTNVAPQSRFTKIFSNLTYLSILQYGQKLSQDVSFTAYPTAEELLNKLGPNCRLECYAFSENYVSKHSGLIDVPSRMCMCIYIQVPRKMES